LLIVGLLFEICCIWFRMCLGEMIIVIRIKITKI